MIQEYLVKCADKHAVPKVDNTNVDRSVAAIHASVLGCLRRRAQVSADIRRTVINQRRSDRPRLSDNGSAGIGKQAVRHVALRLNIHNRVALTRAGRGLAGAAVRWRPSGAGGVRALHVRDLVVLGGARAHPPEICGRDIWHSGPAD